MSLPRCGVWFPVALLLVSLAGCSMAPKSFRKIHDPAAITRARSVSLGSGISPVQKVPTLIDRLEDSDPVVRLAAYEELKKDTGKSFGYKPWASPSDRLSAVARWRDWWNQRRGQPSIANTNPGVMRAYVP
ncbi:MAG: hypothetical protein U0794_12435 [Isosphaeraceae bacterium]